MKYQSTRGGVSGLTFEEALCSGYAKDGGILLPETIPKVSQDQMNAWKNLSYTDLMKEITKLYIDPSEIPENDLCTLIDKAMSRFSIPEVVKIARLKNGLNIMELFHGPTYAFKDLGMCCVGQFMEYFLSKRQKHVNILIGTSGDTGSAAIESVRGLKWVDIFVLLPKGRTSKIQELQMTTVIEDNVHVVRVDGTSDDLDIPIKKCFGDVDFVVKHNLVSMNSINWCRVMCQITHFYYAYFQAQSENREVEIAIPTGAMGNVTGGVIAQQMGLPVKLVCTVNHNDIVARTLEKGDYSMSDVTPSLAPAMDIQIPYNMERIMDVFSGRDLALVKSLVEEFENNGKIRIPDNILKKMQASIGQYSTNNEGIMAAMKRCWDENEYLLCPHSAIAAEYHYSQLDKSDKISRVCVATASPLKFEEAVLEAKLAPQYNDHVKRLPSMPTKYEDWNKGEDWLAMLKNAVSSLDQ